MESTKSNQSTCSCDGCRWNNQSPVPDHQEPCTNYEFDTTTERIITCQGCLENQPNQLAHIGPGGCLGEDDEYN